MVHTNERNFIKNDFPQDSLIMSVSYSHEGSSFTEGDASVGIAMKDGHAIFLQTYWDNGRLGLLEKEQQHGLSSDYVPAKGAFKRFEKEHPDDARRLRNALPLGGVCLLEWGLLD